jgi:hypothetical protein
VFKPGDDSERVARVWLNILIARSETIQSPSAERFWIASLRSQ